MTTTPKSTLNLSQFITVCDHLANLLESGIPLRVSLGILIEDAQDRRQSQVLARMRSELDLGHPFLATLGRLTPPSVTLGFDTVSDTPQLIPLLRSLATHYSQKKTHITELRRQLAYPLILLLGTSVTICGIMWWLVPLYASFFSNLNVPVPVIMRLILVLRDWLSHGGFVSLGIGICLLGIVRLHNIRAWCATLIYPSSCADIVWLLGIFISNGYSLSNALTVIRLNNAHPLRASYTQFCTEFRQTGEFSATFCSHFSLHPYESSVLAHFEKNAKFSTGLLEVSRLIRDRETQTLTRLITLAQPCLLALLAIVIGGCLYLTFIPVLASLAVM